MQIQAVVQAVHTGHRGRFAAATATGVYGSVTFSLEHPVWTEGVDPEPGEIVILDDLRRKQSGWRAHSARYMRLEDEELYRNTRKLSNTSTQTEGDSIEHPDGIHHARGEPG